MFFAMLTNANANPIQYDFSNGTDPNTFDYSSLDFTVGGVIVTATATYDGFIEAAGVNWLGGGLGVESPVPNNDNNNIDGQGQDDYLTFTFDFAVELTAFNFGNDDNTDEFDLYVGTTRVLRNQETDVGWATFATPYVGTSFTVRANQNNDNFAVKNMRVNATAPVPEPSTILLMGLGLAGLVGYNSKRKKLK